MTKENKMFPVHSAQEYQKNGYPSCPDSVPWKMLEPFEEQAMSNHSQDLKTLAKRGGLCPKEIYAIMNKERWKDMGLHIAIEFINDKVKKFHEKETQKS